MESKPEGVSVNDYIYDVYTIDSKYKVVIKWR